MCLICYWIERHRMWGNGIYFSLLPVCRNNLTSCAVFLDMMNCAPLQPQHTIDLSSPRTIVRFLIIAVASVIWTLVITNDLLVFPILWHIHRTTGLLRYIVALTAWIVQGNYEIGPSLIYKTILCHLNSCIWLQSGSYNLFITVFYLLICPITQWIMPICKCSHSSQTG